MKVLLIGSFAESLVNFRGDLIRSIGNAGHDVHVAAPELLCASGLCEQLTLMGASVYDVSLSRTGLNPLADLKSLVSLWRLCRTVKPDLILTYTIKPVVYGTLAATLAGVKYRYTLITGLGYVFNAPSNGVRGILKRILLGLYRVALSCATRVIFQNADDRNLFVDKSLVASRKAKIVSGSGVNIERFAVTPFISRQQGIHFLFIGRLIADKGIYEFVEAARRVRQHYPQCQFHLVGWIDTNLSAIDRNELDRWVTDGLIVYHGRLEDVRPVIEKSHVFVLPSYREGVPRTVLEAMAMGRPIITTDAPGCRETVENGVNGYLVPVKDSASLAGTMLKFIENPELIDRMGAASRKRVEAVFDVHKVNAAMLDIMELS
ncbi:MAG: glycosyltransferase family 1 protein [Desulfuromonas sp.]|mgnify:CR=1 FL=1|nr:MAG: glycosyltransferase family 1 protein [Desulfuromonas sp.]